MEKDPMQAHAGLKALISKPGVTDLLLDGSKNTFVDSGFGLQRSANPFESDSDLSKFIVNLCFDAGTRIDIAKPTADFMVGNLRFHAVLPHGISPQPLLSIRRHTGRIIRLSHLLEVEMFSEETHLWIQGLLSSRANILISGPTSTGKTTLLSALIAETNERVICIEQTPELHLESPALSLREREANQEGVGAVLIQQLVVESLRMRPDRLVVGEVRGSELGVMLQAMNNGHSGTMATLHARSLDEVPNRLAMLGLLAGLTTELTNRLIVGSIDIIIQLQKTGGRRVIAAAGRPILVAGEITVEPIDLGISP